MIEMFEDPTDPNITMYTLRMVTNGCLQAVARYNPDRFQLLIVPEADKVEFLTPSLLSRSSISVGGVASNGVGLLISEFRRCLGIEKRKTANFKIHDEDVGVMFDIRILEAEKGTIEITGRKTIIPETWSTAEARERGAL